MHDEIAQEIQRQLAEGNGGESDSTRGKTLRELVLELRQDGKSKPDRKEVYTVVGVLGAIVIGFATAGF